MPLPTEARDALAGVAASCRDSLFRGAADARRREASRLTWVKPEAYHLTLAFLGEIEAAAVARAASALDAAAGRGSIPFSFAGLGRFPPRGAWRVLFARLDEGGRTAELSRLVGEALGELLPPSTRPFRPHVTLARAGPRGRLEMPMASPMEGAWTIGRCSLYKSELRSAGPVYTELRGVDL